MLLTLHMMKLQMSGVFLQTHIVKHLKNATQTVYLPLSNTTCTNKGITNGKEM